MTPSPEDVERMIAAAQWSAFEKMMAALNGIEDGLTADQMRRRLYGEVHALRPDMLAALSAIGGGK